MPNFGDIVDMGLRRAEFLAHRDDRRMRATGIAPLRNRFRHFERRLLATYRQLPAETHRCSAGFRQILLDPCLSLLGAIDGTHEDMAVCEPAASTECRLAHAADPNRDGSLGSRENAGPVDMVELSVERNDRLGP